MPIRLCGKHPLHAHPIRPLTNSFARLLVMACLAVASRDIIAGPASTPPALRYEIPSSTLDSALQAFADQANIQLLYSPALVRGKYSSGLHGNHTLIDGLVQLLAQHGLTAISVNSNTYLLLNARDRERAAAAPAPQPETITQPRTTEIAPIDVTGTRIPRVSLELSVPMTVITSSDIERGGYRTLYDLLSQQPGLVSHHPIAVSSEGNDYPIVPATGASLYSLGPRATLYLVDGKRTAQFGLASTELGGIFDLNSIPLSFIDRIEILRGGASAVYGADAMAGTINIILKKEYAESAISTRFGVSQRGDARSRGVSALLGVQTRSGGDFLLAADITSQDELGGSRREWHTADQTRLGLPDDRRFIGFMDDYLNPLLPLPQCQALDENPDSPYCRYDYAKYRTLQPSLSTRSLHARWEQALSNSVSLYFSGLHTRSEEELQHRPIYTNLPITPSHPDYTKAPAGTSDAAYALYELGAPRNHNTSITSDLSFGLEGTTRGWNWDITLSHSESRARSNIDNVFTYAKIQENINRIRIDGSDNTDVMNALRTTISPTGSHSVNALEITSNRQLFDAPGGPVQVEMGMAFHAAHRRNSPDPLQIGVYPARLAFASIGTAPYDLHSRDSAVFAEIDLPLHRTLQADLAVRLDHHNDFKTNASPRAGVKWTPNRSLLIRASLGQGYRAPTVNDKRAPFDSISDRLYLRATPQLLPCIQVESNLCLVEYGVGENPHLRAEFSRSLTAGIVWAPIQAFNLSLDGYRILRTDEFGIADAYRYPLLFPDGLVRDSNGVLIKANKYLANIGQSEARGWELESNYFLRSDRLGELYFRVTAHYLDRYIASSLMQPKAIDYAGHDTPKLTMLGSIRWRTGGWTTTLAMRHFGSSRAYAAGETCPPINRNAGKCTNPSVTLFNLNFDYSNSGNWAYSFGINNLLDREPVNYRALLGGYNVAIDDIYGRYFTMSTTRRF